MLWYIKLWDYCIDLKIEQMDVKTEFFFMVICLRHYILDRLRDLLISLNLNMHVFWKKSIYFLKQSPRQWNKNFDSVMISSEFARSKYDVCIWKSEIQSSLCAFCYVLMIFWLSETHKSWCFWDQRTVEPTLWDKGFRNNPKDIGCGDHSKRGQVTKFCFHR